MERRYHTDLSDEEWRCLEPHVPAPKGRGRPRIHTTREVLDAVFYVLKSGCPWRLLPRQFPPRQFPPWEAAYRWFGGWRADGTFERINAALGERLRARPGGDPLPSAGIADSRSAKATGVGGEQRGHDGNKKARGRKRHLLVDTEGSVLEAKVHCARISKQFRKVNSPKSGAAFRIDRPLSAPARPSEGPAPEDRSLHVADVEKHAKKRIPMYSSGWGQVGGGREN